MIRRFCRVACPIQKYGAALLTDPRDVPRQGNRATQAANTPPLPLQPWTDMDSTYPALDSTSGGYENFTASFHTRTWDVTGTYNLAIETWG